MTEHHGLDLKRLTGPNAAHSVFAPSSAAGWLTCADYILANINLPDDAGEDAAYGTVGHEVAEEWLLRIGDLRQSDDDPITEEMIAETWPHYLVGTVRKIKEPSGEFAIEIDEEMLAYVSQYIARCASMPGKHLVEQRGDFSVLTPIPNQKGTADFIAMEPGVLRVRDLKMGVSPRNRVDAAEFRDDPRAVIDGRFNGNPQALIYAIAQFLAWDDVYKFQRIIIYIDQPRLDHFDEWETTREELISFMAFVKERAHLAWAKNRTRTPSEKGCKWCKARRTCPAFVNFIQDAYDDVFDDMDDVPLNSGRSVTVAEMAAASEEFVSGEPPSPPDAASLSTEALTRIYMMKSTVEGFLGDVMQELMNRISRGQEVPGLKLVPGRLGRREWVQKDDANKTWTMNNFELLGLEHDDIYELKTRSPAGIQERLKMRFKMKNKVAESAISDLVTRKPGKETLVLAHDPRVELEDFGKVFDEDDDPTEGL